MRTERNKIVERHDKMLAQCRKELKSTDYSLESNEHSTKEKIVRIDNEEPTASHPRYEKPESLSWKSNLYPEHEPDEGMAHKMLRGAEARSN